MSKQLPDELRHAFRALLRAATYLPDSAARAYIHKYAVHRFRSVADKIKSKNADDSEKLINKYHDNKRIAKVWQLAHQLDRAGQGSERDLKKALYLTYGRAGKRRRELIQELLGPEENTFPEDEAALEELINRPSEKEKQGQNDNPKLKAFIKSQRFNHPADSPRTKVKNLRPQIPEENLWGRPVPLKRQKNIQREYWADTLDKLMPPVPQYEWDRLRDLATGAIPFEEPPPRRSRARDDEPNDQKLWEYFSIPTNRQMLEMEETDFNADDVVTHWESRTNPHTRGMKSITPRFMRRLYATIWGMTPTMSQDESTKEWTIKWGGGRSAAHCGQVTAPSANDMELFEGADEQVKSADGASISRAQKRRERKLGRHRPQDRPAPRTPLGNEGYTQGVVPAI